MKASRRVKRAFLGGALLTIITVMLMLGSTMAWFQDSEVVINTYTFGNLNVDIVDEQDATVGTRALRFVKPESVGGYYGENEFLFEPGATFQLEEFCIKNSGNVALKYRLELDASGAEGDRELLDAMDTYATMDESAFELKTETSTLAAGQKSGPVKIFLHMQEGAGNEYQDLTVKGLVVKVIAVQNEGIPDDQLESAFAEAAAKQSKKGQ